MSIRLSDHFDYRRLLRFCLSPVIMMVFTSIYGVVDGLFVSNYAGTVPFAAINLVMPFIMILGGFGFMLGTGGSALVAITLGEGDHERANRYFSMIIGFTVVSGVVLSILGILFMRPISIALGATEGMLEHCVIYGRTVLAFNTAFMLQNTFQTFLATAEKPKLGLLCTVAAGVTNVVLDALFVAVFPLGVFGAALATGISECVGGLIPFLYFLRPNKSLLRLTSFRFEPKTILRASANGSSELMSSISGSVVSMLYNFQLLKFAGENGVAVYGVLMYVQFIFVAVFIGYTIGTAPVIGYHYGADNSAEVRGILKKSLILMLVGGLLMMLLALVLGAPIAEIFVGYNKPLLKMTVAAFRIFSLSFILTGVNIFMSSFFTALGNGAVSAAISFLRTLVFQSLSLLVLPILFGLNGIWYALSVAEVLGAIISMLFLAFNRRKYNL